MRVVIDSNVLISSMMFRNSVPRRCVSLVKNLHSFLVSSETIAEFYDVIHRDKFNKYIDLENRGEYFDYLFEDGQEIEVNEVIEACRDPKDNKYLSLAVSGNADAIVTGDADLLALHPFRGVAILTPQQFVKQFATG